MRELTLEEIEAVSGAGFWGDFWGGISSFLQASADFLGFDGQFGYQGGGGGGSLSLRNLFAGIGDLLGFDGQIGYQTDGSCGCGDDQGDRPPIDATAVPPPTIEEMVRQGLPAITEMSNQDLFEQQRVLDLMREDQQRAHDQCMANSAANGALVGGILFGLVGLLGGPEGTGPGFGLGLGVGAAAGTSVGAGLC